MAHPDMNFLGIEIVRKYQLFTATRLAKRRLRNVRVACADARLFLRDCVAGGVAAGGPRLLPRPVVEGSTTSAASSPRSSPRSRPHPAARRQPVRRHRRGGLREDGPPDRAG